MPIDSFFRNLGALVAGMALLSILETLVPFFDADFRRRHLFPNLALSAITLLLNFAFNAGAVLVTAWLGPHGFGLLPGAALGSVTTTLLGVVALDASTYACHRLMHVSPWLWRAHRVHHSDPLVDVTTALRFHPIETIWRFAFIAGPAILLGLPVQAVAFYRVASAFMAIFEHANVTLGQPVDTALSLFLGTPNLHKVHHSRVVTETNTNYGNILSLFDRAFGTFTPSARAARVRCGLDGHDGAETQALSGLLRLPFIDDPLAEHASEAPFRPASSGRARPAAP